MQLIGQTRQIVRLGVHIHLGNNLSYNLKPMSPDKSSSCINLIISSSIAPLPCTNECNLVAASFAKILRCSLVGESLSRWNQRISEKFKMVTFALIILLLVSQLHKLGPKKPTTMQGRVKAIKY